MAGEHGDAMTDQIKAAIDAETAPDIAGRDVAPEEQNGQASDDGMPEAEFDSDPGDGETPPWVAEGRDPTADEKINVLAGTIEYHDEQIAEIREACSQMARVLVRLVQAVDGATGPAKVYGPDGQPLNRKQRRDIEFGR